MTKEEAIKYLQQLYPNGGHCWLDEQRIEAIGMAVKALQEEPESVWHDANEKSDNPEAVVIINPSDNTGEVLTKCTSVYQGRIWAYTSVLLNLDNPCKIGKNIQEEPVSDDLGDYIYELSKQFPEVSFAKLSRIAVRVAKWQKEHLWKPADGDDLPEIDREVVVLEGIVDPTATDCFYGYKVVFAHRPPEFWDGKDIVTGKVTRNYPKTYGEGGWNIPNIVYWLDVELLKEIEL